MSNKLLWPAKNWKRHKVKAEGQHKFIEVKFQATNLNGWVHWEKFVIRKYFYEGSWLKYQKCKSSTLRKGALILHLQCVILFSLYFYQLFWVYFANDYASNMCNSWTTLWMQLGQVPATCLRGKRQKPHRPRHRHRQFLTATCKLQLIPHSSARRKARKNSWQREREHWPEIWGPDPPSPKSQVPSAVSWVPASCCCWPAGLHNLWPSLDQTDRQRTLLRP